METNSTNPQQGNNAPANKNCNGARLALKLSIIFALSLLLLIPQAFIQNLVDERISTEWKAGEEIAEKWGDERTINGPVILIPGDNTKHNLYILPETLSAEGNIETQQLRRGIYNFTVYEAPLTFAGSFVLPKEVTAEQLSHLRSNQARLLIAVNDFRGFTDYPSITFNGRVFELSAEGYKLGGDDALSCPIDIQSLMAHGTDTFSLSIPIKGSNSLALLPMGRTTDIHFTSDCPTPSFDGRYLPASREVTDKGFTAEWKVLALNRDFPHVLKSQDELSCSGAVQIKLRAPVEQYQQTTRCIKYAYLIILLTFAVVFFVETRRKTPIHPIQYALVGLALMLFYTLLLSFSEQLTFTLSYLIAGGMTIGLITLFMRALLKHAKAAFAIGGLLVALYAFIFVIMQLENYALLVGSIGIFIVLALSMYASQKINWYN